VKSNVSQPLNKDRQNASEAAFSFGRKGVIRLIIRQVYLI